LTDDLKRKALRVEKLFKLNWMLAIISVSLGQFKAFSTTTLHMEMNLDYKDNMPKYYFIFIVQCICNFGFVCIAPALDYFAIFFINYAAVLMENLNENVSSIKNYEELKYRIEEFTKIKLYIRDLEGIFSRVLLVQGLTKGVILCMISFHLSLVSKFIYLRTLLSFSFRFPLDRHS